MPHCVSCSLLFRVFIVMLLQGELTRKRIASLRHRLVEGPEPTHAMDVVVLWWVMVARVRSHTCVWCVYYVCVCVLFLGCSAERREPLRLRPSAGSWQPRAACPQKARRHDARPRDRALANFCNRGLVQVGIGQMPRGLRPLFTLRMPQAGGGDGL